MILLGVLAQLLATLWGLGAVIRRKSNLTGGVL